MSNHPGFEAGELEFALSSVAHAISTSLELDAVWERVAEACRVVVPFDGMGISRYESGDRVRVAIAARVVPADELNERIFLRTEYSPRLWLNDDNLLVLVRDAASELDPAYPVDRALLELGIRSILKLPLGRGAASHGALILVAVEPNRFDESHARGLAVVAELVGVALAHERLAGAEAKRRRRREALERLLPAFARSLDVRAIFQQLSQIAQEILPHDFLALGLLSADRKHATIHAAHGATRDVREMPEYPLGPEEQVFMGWEYVVVRDYTVLPDYRVRAQLVHSKPDRPHEVDVQLDPFWIQGYTVQGIRSRVRVPVRLNGELAGGLDFMSRTPGVYDEEDAEFALRVAEHVALALAHHELAEEARRAAAAEQRAEVLAERVQLLSRELEALSPHRALGRSRRWRDVLDLATKVASTETTVLLTGESGTGKEVVARLIHRGSPRKDGPFVALNCAALPEQLLESELFGHERGAFTGALTARAGKIEQAAGGVLFLDEVGEMSPAVQAKFLRVLQEREYQRVGGAVTQKANARVLAATNRNLKTMIGQGTFREDLYYRLAVFELALPPLRERTEDIFLLVDAFLEEIGRSIGRPAAGVSREVHATLLEYPWPGNVRELRNALERAVILCDGGLITSEHLPVGITALRVAQRAAPSVASASAVAASSSAVPSPMPIDGRDGRDSAARPRDRAGLDAAEREMIIEALGRAGDNKSKAARLLGLTRAQLRTRIEKHGLQAAD